MNTHPTEPGKLSAFAVRKLIDELLRTDSDLQSFLIDEFRDVHLTLSDGMTRPARVSILFKKVGEQEVANRLQQRHPAQFAQALSMVSQPTSPEKIPSGGRSSKWVMSALIGLFGGAVGVYWLMRSTDQSVPPSAAKMSMDATTSPTAPTGNLPTPSAATPSTAFNKLETTTRTLKTRQEATSDSVPGVQGKPRDSLLSHKTGSATCQGTRCVIHGASRTELGDALLCLSSDNAETRQKLTGVQPTCTLIDGGADVICYRSDEFAVIPLQGAVTWKIPCP